MLANKDDFHHGGPTEEDWKLVGKPPKRVKKDGSVNFGLMERLVTNIRIKAPRGLTFNLAKQVRAALTQLWMAGNTMVVIPLLEEPEAAPVGPSGSDSLDQMNSPVVPTVCLEFIHQVMSSFASF
jgi:hypothetical protein